MLESRLTKKVKISEYITTTVVFYFSKSNGNVKFIIILYNNYIIYKTYIVLNMLPSLSLKILSKAITIVIACLSMVFVV